MKQRGRYPFRMSAVVVAALVGLTVGCEEKVAQPAAPAPSPTPATPPTAQSAEPAQAASAEAVEAESEEAPPESIAAQHVLVAYRGATRAPKDVKRTKAEAKKLAEEVREKALAGTDFSELAGEYSDDPGGKANRGNLGKFKRESKVKRFSDAAFQLKVGQVSEVVETEFGYHVIKRNQ